MPPQFALVPRRDRDSRKILLIVLAVLLVLGAAGAGAAYALMKNDDAAEPATAEEIRLAVPDELVGRPRITLPEVQAGVDESLAQLKQEQPGLIDTVAAAYGDLLGQDVMMIIAARKETSVPAELMDKLVGELTSSNKLDATMSDVDPGPLGGVARCGDARAAGAAAAQKSTAICIWVDHGSFGTAFLYDRTSRELRKDFVEIRSAVEQTG